MEFRDYITQLDAKIRSASTNLDHLGEVKFISPTTAEWYAVARWVHAGAYREHLDSVHGLRARSRHASTTHLA